MELSTAIFLAVIVAILSFILLASIGIKTWSALVLSMLIGVGIMVLFYPISKLSKRKICNGVLSYTSILMFVGLFIAIYVIVKCATDFKKC